MTADDFAHAHGGIGFGVAAEETARALEVLAGHIRQGRVLVQSAVVRSYATLDDFTTHRLMLKWAEMDKGDGT